MQESRKPPALILCHTRIFDPLPVPLMTYIRPCCMSTVGRDCGRALGRVARSVVDYLKIHDNNNIYLIERDII